MLPTGSSPFFPTRTRPGRNSTVEGLEPLSHRSLPWLESKDVIDLLITYVQMLRTTYAANQRVLGLGNEMSYGSDRSPTASVRLRVDEVGAQLRRRPRVFHEPRAGTLPHPIWCEIAGMGHRGCAVLTALKWASFSLWKAGRCAGERPHRD